MKVLTHVCRVSLIQIMVDEGKWTSSSFVRILAENKTTLRDVLNLSTDTC